MVKQVEIFNKTMNVNGLIITKIDGSAKGGALVSIAKKYEEIFTLNNSEPIRLSYNNPTLKLLQSIRDEAHRFALKYQKIKRKDKKNLNLYF